MSTDEYVPSIDGVRARYVLGGMPDNAMHDQIARAVKREGPEFDRFLARVRRDAAREALDGLAATHDAQVFADFGIRNSSRIGQEARIYRDTHYPEETP